MLANAVVQATIPAEDVQRAVKFYTEVLGLKQSEGSDDFAVFDAGKGTQILMYKKARSKAEHTAITFTVDDLDATMQGLKAKGVTFNQYDMEEVKTNADGIFDAGEFRLAWLTDPEGNILGLVGE
jgi:predicted enzyme related to lactoylglutathione lyase